MKHETSAQFIDTVAAIADTFGGINLEDIKAPECFGLKQALIARCDIPVFHDDQHGTAIVTAAGLLNALEVQGQGDWHQPHRLHGRRRRHRLHGSADQVRGCADNIFMLDRQGVIHSGRTDLNQYKQRFANDTPAPDGCHRRG